MLGICLGMQLMCKFSEENNTTCLGIFNETVKRFIPEGDKKVPHMGWNKLRTTQPWLDAGLDDQYVYFVHSYYVPVNPFTSGGDRIYCALQRRAEAEQFLCRSVSPGKIGRSG